MRRSIVAPLFAVAVVIACHQQSPEQTAQRSARNVITQEQIDSTSAASVYDLIARLHGDYLRDRGKLSIKTDKRDVAVVFMNDQPYGVLETLRNIPPSRVSEIRFFTGIEAVARYGSQYGGGVVLLVSRNQ